MLINTLNCKHVVFNPIQHIVQFYIRSNREFCVEMLIFTHS